METRSVKRIVVSYVAGIASALALLVYLGGEFCTQAGLRLAAIESGFRLAAHHWEFEAVPAHQEPVAVAQIENVPAVKKGTKRR